jgi:hypothetical protein
VYKPVKDLSFLGWRQPSQRPSIYRTKRTSHFVKAAERGQKLARDRRTNRLERDQVKVFGCATPPIESPHTPIYLYTWMDGGQYSCHLHTLSKNEREREREEKCGSLLAPKFFFILPAHSAA